MENTITLFSFQENAEKKLSMLEEQIKNKKLRFSKEDFNSLSDYLLLRKHIKRIKSIKRIGKYIIASAIVKVPYGREIKEVERALIIGIDENLQFFVAYSNISDIEEIREEEDLMSFVFNFSSDFGYVDFVDFSKEEDREIRARVQGDIGIHLIRVRDVKEAYLQDLLVTSFNSIMNMLERETLARISDILESYGISSEISDNTLIVECSWKGINFDNLFKRIALELYLADIFPDYYRARITISPIYEIAFRKNYGANDYGFSIHFNMRGIHRGFRFNENVLLIGIRYDFSRVMPSDALQKLFKEIIKPAEEEGIIEEGPSTIKLGRHNIFIEKAYPRQIGIDFKFPFTERVYNIVLRSDMFFTNGTKIKMIHPQHREKTLILPPCAFTFYNIAQPYRTNAMKNTLLMQYYFR